MSAAEVARAYVHRQAKAARDLLTPFSPAGIGGLRRELGDLPALFDEFSSALRFVATDETAPVLKAAARRKPDELDRFVSSVLAQVELPLTRAALAKTALALREDAAIDDHLSAAALVDLDDASSNLLHATLLATAELDAVSAGRSRHDRHPAHA